MKVIVVGSGPVGTAVQKLLKEKGHEVVTVGRKSGDLQADTVAAHFEFIQVLS